MILSNLRCGPPYNGGGGNVTFGTDTPGGGQTIGANLLSGTLTSSGFSRRVICAVEPGATSISFHTFPVMYPEAGFHWSVIVFAVGTAA